MSVRTRGPVLILSSVALMCAGGHARGASNGFHPVHLAPPSPKGAPTGGAGTSRLIANAALLKRGFAVSADGRVGAMVELVDPTAVEAYLHTPGVSTMGAGAKDSSVVGARAAAAARVQVAQLDQIQREMADILTGPGLGAALIYRVQRVYNGIAVQVDPAALDQIRALPGVKAVHPLVPKHLDNFTSVPFIGAPQVWGGVGGGATGAGVKVGVIDTGIDYIHRDFGGSGTYRTDGNYVSATWPKTAKVVGGYDFAGDNYDATAAAGSATPVPDSDPMDCNGHGSHVAGTLAGYGENADGSTFGGPWNAAAPISTMMIGPGVAPQAQLYALKIFGCSGSTNLVTPAIDWAVDPNGDGNFADHLDVISMSLGSEYGVPDDPDSVAADHAAELGVVVVAAAGNSGDAYFDVNTPSSAGRAISVAAAGDPGAVYATLRVNSPAAVAGDVPGQPALFGPTLPSTPITGTLVYATPHDGCSALTNAGAVSGNVVLVDRNFGASNACNFTVKVKNAQSAGAIAAVVADNVSESFLVSMVGSDQSITIPSFFISLANGAALEAQLPTPGINASLIKLDMADTVASFTSRGPRSGDGALKPDVTAPGLQIFSVSAGTGTGGVSLDGTSMATPHVAGVMALLRQLHPAWTVEELKALAMNTAVHDVTLNPNGVPPDVGPGRAGAGRVDAAAAAAAEAVAFDADDPGLVSVSFGAVEVATSATLTKNILVENKSNSAQTYALGFTPFATVPGVSFSFPNGTSLTVPPGGSVTFPVQLNADGAAMRHTKDPSVSTTSEGFPRSWLSEEDGVVTLAGPAGPPLRVPVYAAPRPVSAMSALQSTVGLSGASGVATLDLVGRGISTGPAYPTDILSLVSAFELVEDNPTPATSDARYLGVASDVQYQVQNGKTLADSTIFFGIAFQRGWSSPVPLIADIFIDANGDGTPDFDLEVTDYSLFSGNGEYDDVYVASLCSTSNLACDTMPVNGITPDVMDTVPMNTDVIVLPVAVTDLGLTSGKSRIRFYFNRPTATAQVVHGFDPVNPGLSFGGQLAVAGSGQPVFADLPSRAVQVSYSQPNYTTDGAQGILLLHHHNGAGSRAESIAAQFGACSVSATATVPAAAIVAQSVSFQTSASSTACTGGATYLWDFGDGSDGSSLQNPSHAYARAGTYAWRLVVSYGSFSVTKTGSITIAGPLGVARRRLGRLPPV